MALFDWLLPTNRSLRFCLFALLGFLVLIRAEAVEAPADRRVEISFPAAIHPQPVTGRLLLMFSQTNDPEVRFQVGWAISAPIFGMDVNQLRAGQPAVFDGSVSGYPLNSLRDLPPGDYFVQALLNVYTEFHRADGHVIWAHMDQWEGQNFKLSPGNLFSTMQKVHLDAGGHEKLEIQLTQVIPPIEVPADTVWVKHVKIQSALLTRFWGRPMYLGAVVLLPRDYDAHPEMHYPVIYQQGHFSHNPPFEFRTTPGSETEEERQLRESRGLETGYEFYQSWNSDTFPRAISVTFLHPTPYYDDSYAVDSANNGPYGTAIMTELIPYLEKQFRIISEPYARILTGGSTGGWEALALQLFHPDFFGGAWVLYPDPLDFRRYQLIDIYKDPNSFFLTSDNPVMSHLEAWTPVERSYYRTPDGQSLATVRQISRVESVLGSNDRSGGQIAIWDATYGPVGDDGYPKPLWDKHTGAIDRSVAIYMRDHGYDLRYYAESNWGRIGQQLVGKLSLYCGDMDNYYLNLGVYLFAQFLQGEEIEASPDSLEYGRPLKGHGWQPMTNAALIRVMMDRVLNNAPKDASVAWVNH
jgi:Putative esterase